MIPQREESSDCLCMKLKLKKTYIAILETKVPPRTTVRATDMESTIV